MAPCTAKEHNRARRTPLYAFAVPLDGTWHQFLLREVLRSRQNSTFACINCVMRRWCSKAARLRMSTPSPPCLGAPCLRQFLLSETLRSKPPFPGVRCVSLLRPRLAKFLLSKALLYPTQKATPQGGFLLAFLSFCEGVFPMRLRLCGRPLKNGGIFLKKMSKRT